MEKVGNGLIKHHRLKFNMQSHKRIIAPGLILMMLASTLLSIAAPVQANPAEEVSVLHTEVNPANNKTYHLLTASSWEDAAFKARSLNGYLTTIDDADENTWVFDTFASFDNQSRHLWIGLNDVQDEGIYRWLMAHHFCIETGVLINQLAETTPTMFTSHPPTWATSCPKLGTILKTIRNISLYTE